MPAVPYTAGLHQVADGAYAYLQPDGSWGLSNSGVVDGGGRLLLVDTLYTLGLTRRLLDAVDRRLPGASVATVVTTHGNGDHCWGHQLLPDAQIVASAATAAGLPDEIGPQAMTRMRAEAPPGSPLGDYMRRYFGGYDWSGITPVPPTATFTGHTSLQVGGRVVQLVEVGPAHTAGDVVVHLPDAGVVYAGDIVFAGDHPVMWSGPLDNWVAACQWILDTGADTVVPGHGPVTGPAGVRALRDYLTAVGEHATAQHAAGVPYHIAAARMPLHHWPRWRHPERLVVTIGTVYAQLGSPEPGGRAALIGRMAQAHHHRRIAAAAH